MDECSVDSIELLHEGATEIPNVLVKCPLVAVLGQVTVGGVLIGGPEDCVGHKWGKGVL